MSAVARQDQSLEETASVQNPPESFLCSALRQDCAVQYLVWGEERRLQTRAQPPPALLTFQCSGETEQPAAISASAQCTHTGEVQERRLDTTQLYDTLHDLSNN